MTGKLIVLTHGYVKKMFFVSHRATIEEVEGDVCELESKLDKVSTTHEKHCLIVQLLCCFTGHPVSGKSQVCFRLCRQQIALKED